MGISKFFFIILTIFSISIGQILFRFAVQSQSGSTENFMSGLANWKVFLALVVYAMATIMWLYVLRDTPLRLAYPFAALAFFIVPVLAHFFLGEKITLNTCIGAAIIALGVWISIYE